jgi:hypothetical protein
MKYSSILDYQKNTLSSDIWDQQENLKPGVKKFILSCLQGFFDQHDIKGYDEFITRIVIGSSLATYLYRDNTDLDIKVLIDLKSFNVENNNID